MIALLKNMTWAVVCLSSLMRTAAVMPLLSALTSPATAQLQNQAPEIRPCPLPNQSELDLDSILGYVSKKVPDARVVTLISLCHAGFTLGPSQIESLTAAGTSKPILDALDRDTLSRLSLAEARREVEALESRLQANMASANVDRDALLRRSDADYNAQREKAAHLEKSEFETTDQYRTKIAQATAAADRNHDAEQSRITERFRADLERKNKPLESRVATLKAGLFRVSGSVPTWIRYDADASTLTAGIDGEEYWFSAEPSHAQTLKEHWSSAQVLEPYEDDGSHKRFLAEISIVEPVPGRPRVKIEEEEKEKEVERLLEDARRSYAAGKYEEAISAYERANSLIPNNRRAIDGIAEMRLAIAQRAAAVAQAAALQQRQLELAQNPTLIPGTWYDAATHLLWTDRDNGRSVTWDEANSYCSQLSVSGSSEWRLPAINELTRIYDPKQSKHNESQVKVAFQGGAFIYHIKGGIIHLSEPSSGVWSLTPSEGGRAVKNFCSGKSEPQNVRDKTRALCVGNIQLSGMPLPPPTESLVQAGAGESTSALEGEWRGTLSTRDRPLAAVFQIGPGGSGTLRSSTLPATPFTYSLNGNRIAMKASSARLAGGYASYAATVNGDQMTGTWSQSGMNLPLTLTRAGAGQIANPIRPNRPNGESQSTPQTQPTGVSGRAPVVPGAVPPAASTIQVEGRIQELKLVKKTAPVYPPLAKNARIQGIVKLWATIGADGLIKNLSPLSGPRQLVQSAVDAVKQWQYEPTVVNGSPVAVVTTVDVSFMLTP